MSQHDPRIDAYIAKSPVYAQPILAHLRALVHATCPDVDETMKWSMPFFDYRGSPLCNMAAFKAHCSLGFWRARDLPDLPKQVGEDGMGNLGRIRSLDDLPPTPQMVAHVRAAMTLNEAPARTARARKVAKPALDLPDDLARELDNAPAAAEHFAALTPGARRDYVEWIVEAKREATRATRIATAVAWIAEGKTRHWKYRA